ncbi:DNA binding domain protein, excisionase family [Asticcacaulis biprosthecium C19]|uniref:DNA binding domain protein, excisionase family n=1 Tax=Asticcacaulis biprosthecium C19 TaxID=715226 RepID=F4QI37_9CAUL|nr:helix-turn-helix domain-containing protein [Asticcacaulis biprosthecium]EGF92904.1 DNA binding domain protein, excisionase family [Asticcacaulis biprosthecium C19]
MTDLWDTRKTAQHLGIAEITLRRWRLTGGGPAYLKLGRAVRYDPASLANFLASRVRDNTSQGVGA